MPPRAAIMSSEPENAEDRELFPAKKCIGGSGTGTSFSEPKNSRCLSGTEKAPWLAIDYGANVTVEEVVLYNREDCCHE